MRRLLLLVGIGVENKQNRYVYVAMVAAVCKQTLENNRNIK